MMDDFCIHSSVPVRPIGAGARFLDRLWIIVKSSSFGGSKSKIRILAAGPLTVHNILG
jgi:hypothetical protein